MCAASSTAHRPRQSRYQLKLVCCPSVAVVWCRGGAAQSAGTQDVSEQIHEALLKTLGKAKRKLDQFDMASKMREKGLEQIFEAETWPAIGAVRELATKIRKRTANGVEPFVFADLRKWARASAATHLCSWSALCGQVPPHICARVCAGAA